MKHLIKLKLDGMGRGSVSIGDVEIAGLVRDATVETVAGQPAIVTFT